MNEALIFFMIHAAGASLIIAILARVLRRARRDYFAAQAMVGHAQALANWDCSSEKEWHAEVARVSYATADAMIAARKGGAR